MKTVYKYELDCDSVEGSQHRIHLEVPNGAKPLSVGVQRGTVCLWMEVDTVSPPRPVHSPLRRHRARRRARG